MLRNTEDIYATLEIEICDLKRDRRRSRSNNTENCSLGSRPLMLETVMKTTAYMGNEDGINDVP
jgi:hypothetical protein